MTHERVDQLASLCGIQRAYHDVWGRERHMESATRDAFLAAMGIDVGDPAAVEAALLERQDAPWRRLLPRVAVVRRDDPGAHVLVTLSARELDGELAWRCVAEDGEVLEGRVAAASLDVSAGRSLDGLSYSRHPLRLPPLPLGYHRLEVRTHARAASMRLVVAPRACYVPEVLLDGRRLWGPTVQLYALRSRPDLGVGTYASLGELAAATARHGAGFVGVSPLHALFPHAPERSSPYSPSSRAFLNVMYLDVHAVPELAECAPAKHWLAQAEVAARIARAADAELVDYAEVAAIKRPALELLYEHFRAQHLSRGDARAQAFRAFQAGGGAALQRHALHEALQEHFSARDAALWGWPVWPEAYRDPESPEVRDFAARHAERVEFFAYLQWLADEQLAAASHAARAAGMPLGLYVDLAVGIDRGGSEAWSHQGLYAAGVSVGAPPDVLAPKGQDWGLPPMVPERLIDAEYEPFVATLRRCMRHAGALRIDHVMALMRLFWVPPGADARAGGYVRYPFQDLLGLLALESQRARCLVIGEDLGTVPDEVRTALAAHQVLSYRVFYFENGQDGRPKAPAEYPAAALVTAGTHDLATLAGFWQGHDVALRAALELYPSAEMSDEQRRGRAEQRHKILDALEWARLYPRDAARPRDAMTAELVRAIYAFLASTPAWLLGVQLEDVLGVIDQPNLPGTVDEHPNWRRRLPVTVGQVGASAALRELADTLRRVGR